MLFFFFPKCVVILKFFFLKICFLSSRNSRIYKVKNRRSITLNRQWSKTHPATPWLCDLWKCFPSLVLSFSKMGWWFSFPKFLLALKGYGFSYSQSSLAAKLSTEYFTIQSTKLLSWCTALLLEIKHLITFNYNQTQYLIDTDSDLLFSWSSGN